MKIDPTNAAIDLSFCHIGIDGIPSLLHFLSQCESTRCQGVTAEDVAERSSTREADVVAEASHFKLPLELSLRECSLGDIGVASLAESSWFWGSEGAKVLSLRHNQVTPCVSPVAHVSRQKLVTCFRIRVGFRSHLRPLA